MTLPDETTPANLAGYSRGQIMLHSENAFVQMRKIGQIAARTLAYIGDYVTAGISTVELDALIDDHIREQGAIPATIGYNGYRHASCISVNHVAVHGVPGEKKLRDGDILNIDITPRLNGWHGDSSRMYMVGNKVSVKARRLVEATEKSLQAGLEAVRPGVPLKEIARACETVAKDYGFEIVGDFCGHGIGQIFHDHPEVHHCDWGQEEGPLLTPGMFFTIEPVLSAGKPQVKILSDDWTAVTRDRSLTAQMEHTIGVTADGYEIFTSP